MWGDSTWGLGGASGLPQQPAGTTDSTWGFGGGNALPQQPAGKVNDSSDIWNESLPTEQSNSSSKEVFDQGWNMPQVEMDFDAMLESDSPQVDQKQQNSLPSVQISRPMW